mmetsp:Transcript_92243/g.250293  ORF Transcript_92243/g.250293 Transcript_92243/m.250293 type:complete len:249 (-) Transcript_92243:444-1190(-)
MADNRPSGPGFAPPRCWNRSSPRQQEQHFFAAALSCASRRNRRQRRPFQQMTLSYFTLTHLPPWLQTVYLDEARSTPRTCAICPFSSGELDRPRSNTRTPSSRSTQLAGCRATAVARSSRSTLYRPRASSKPKMRPLRPLSSGLLSRAVISTAQSCTTLPGLRESMSPASSRTSYLSRASSHLQICADLPLCSGALVSPRTTTLTPGGFACAAWAARLGRPGAPAPVSNENRDGSPPSSPPPRPKGSP